VELILKKCLGLLKALARGNDFVQLRMFERLDILLKIKAVESDVAVALKEVRALSASSLSSVLQVGAKNNALLVLVSQIVYLHNKTNGRYAEHLPLVKIIISSTETHINVKNDLEN